MNSYHLWAFQPSCFILPLTGTVNIFNGLVAECLLNEKGYLYRCLDGSVAGTSSNIGADIDKTVLFTFHILEHSFQSKDI